MSAIQDIIGLAFWTGFSFGIAAGCSFALFVVSIACVFHLRSIGK